MDVQEKGRQEARELERLDKAIADLLQVDVEYSLDIGSWVIAGTEERYNPTFDYDLAFRLFLDLEMQIVYYSKHIEIITHWGKESPRLVVMQCPRGSNVLKLICMTALRKQELESRGY